MKIKTSNFSKAKEMAEAFEKNHGVKAGVLSGRIPEEIEAKNGKNHYHVLMVKKRHDAKNERYIVTGTVQTFGKGLPFEKIVKKYKNHGFASLIVVHDPTTIKDQPKDELKLHEISAIRNSIEAEEKAEMNKRIAARKAKAIEDAKTEKAAEAKKEEDAAKKDAVKKTTGLTFEGIEVTEENVDQFGKDNKIEFGDAKTPEGKLALVKKYIASKTNK